MSDAAQSYERNWLRHPRLREAAQLIEHGQMGAASGTLRGFLKAHPGDAHALHLLGEIAYRQGRTDQALASWGQCVDIAPDFTPARHQYAAALLGAARADVALLHSDQLLKRDSRNPDYRALKARALEALDDYSAAADLWRGLLKEYPDRAYFWTCYGYVLRGLGMLPESIAACRKVIELDPASGSAWWNLADIKTFRFAEADIQQMEKQIANAELPAAGRACVHFALGKAHGDLKQYETSFGHYAKGNALRRLALPHDPDVLTAYVARSKLVFSEEFFRARSGRGCESPDPIFIVGMMRSGSTLVEQILSSHSQVEGTRELAEVAAASHHLQRFASKKGCDFPSILERVDAGVFCQLGERYLENTRVHRKLGRPYFIDKMGANFGHVGLIHLLLPNAKIVDVRRHPLACGFSIFSQYFPKGQNNTYKLADIGRNYRDYVELMAHFDRVLPARIHRVFYESLIAEPEAEIRRLLAYLGLPFEESCRDFHRTERTIATVSAEQVRSPIYHTALEHWRNYEPWLAPLKEVLGAVLDDYPAAPEFH
ncbi:MAG TPA: sulfotransferase [Rhizomicrobium sp.]|nr:sulfotransferase [Rhizomicrobium sp.]